MYGWIKPSLLAGAVPIAAAGAFAYAARGGGFENDALAIDKAGFPLIQAVTAAEQRAKGKAARAEYGHSKQGGVDDVEVASGARVFDARVDAQTGTVISSAEDKTAHDDAHHKTS